MSIKHYTGDMVHFADRDVLFVKYEDHLKAMQENQPGYYESIFATKITEIKKSMANYQINFNIRLAAIEERLNALRGQLVYPKECDCVNFNSSPTIEERLEEIDNRLKGNYTGE